MQRGGQSSDDQMHWRDSVNNKDSHSISADHCHCKGGIRLTFSARVGKVIIKMVLRPLEESFSLECNGIV
jgi:hypothetical protein